MIAGLRRRRGPQPEVLTTARLELVPMTVAMLEAETQADGVALAALLQAELPEWPPALWEPAVWMHIAAQLEAQPETLGWHRYMVLRAPRPRVVGCLGGFPCPHGDVELGYSVAGPEQGRGYASEAANCLITWLYQRPHVRSVSAQAFQSSPASVRVMQRCGMVCVGAGDHPGSVRYRRWRL